MAVTLYLLRHAKAVVADGTIPDFDRPLADRGHREAAELATLLRERAYAPSRVLCSSSQRTRETLAPLLGAWPTNISIDIHRELYDASADDLLALVRAQHSDVRSLLLVGHNPAIEQAARALANAGDHSALRRLHDHYPPAGFTVVDLEVAAWADVRPGAGKLAAFETPRG